MSGLGNAIAAVILALSMAFIAVKGAGIIAAESTTKPAARSGDCANVDGSKVE